MNHQCVTRWIVASLLVLAGCGRSDGSAPLATGGDSAVGGSAHTGGDSAFGGAAVSGGAAQFGGAVQSGGSASVATSSTGGLMDAGANQRLRDYLGNSSYPDDFWQTATFPEAHMASEPLERAVDFIQQKGWEIHAFLIARGGRLVFERYGWKSGNNPSDPDRTPHAMLPSERHPIFSVTKSVVSALVGLAIDEGVISGVDHKVADWFSDYASLNPSAQKSSITLDQLLTMRSGLEFAEGESAVFNDEPNPARALLARNLVSTPGSTWNYSSGDAEIVSEVLRITTGLTPLAYAQSKLFGPLGIVNPPWDAGQSGTNHGGFGLSLTAREMARFGELYRNYGVWANQQVVPSSWVTNSTSYKCATAWGMDYGYYWFLPDLNDFFVAIGFNGQQIFVSRSAELVIVFLGDLPSSEANIDYTQIITSYVLPALQ